MAKLRMAHASTHGARKSPGPTFLVDRQTFNQINCNNGGLKTECTIEAPCRSFKIPKDRFLILAKVSRNIFGLDSSDLVDALEIVLELCK